MAANPVRFVTGRGMPAAGHRCSVVPIRTSNQLLQLDLTELGLLEDQVRQDQRKLRESLKRRDEKRNQIIAALKAGAVIEPGPHTAWLTHRGERLTLA